MKKLMLGLMMAFAVTAEAKVTIDGINYEFDRDAGTATITGYDRDNPPTKVDVAEVEDDGGEKYIVTSVGRGAFQGCSSLTSVYLPNATTIVEYAFNGCGLTSVSLPNATTIEGGAFNGCEKLTSVSLPNATTIGRSAFALCNVLSSLVVNSHMAVEIEKNKKSYYGILSPATITVFEPLSEEVVKAAGYEVKEAVVEAEYKITPSSVTLKSGDTVLDENDYVASCAFYGRTPQAKPETPYTPKEEDFKFVPPTSVVVSKESIAAPSAGTVKVENNTVQLGVTVLKTSDLTDEKGWGEVTLSADDVKVVDGKIVISVPVDSASGFMILQSKDAKIGKAE